MADNGEVIVRFDDVTYGYEEKKPLLKEANFSIRRNSKMTLMGQNGAGKSTIFKMIKGELKPQKGSVHINKEVTVGTAEQVMNPDFAELTVEDYFARAFDDVPRNLPAQINTVLAAVNYTLSHDMKIKDLSGGQQARLLLAYALIQKPDILLLDEPTNNLDEAGIGHLMMFLMMYEKTVIVISHDANFLSTFTEGIVYLDAHTKLVEQYVGDYNDALEKIKQRIEAEQRKNAQLRKEIQDKKDKINFFANKGGKMRKLASKMREEVADAEENMVGVKQDDKTITRFEIEAEHYVKPLAILTSVSVWDGTAATAHETNIELRMGDKLQIKGPNGIGKTTMLQRIAKRQELGVDIPEDVEIGYYRQDFSGLDFSKTAYESLQEFAVDLDKETIFSTAARFLLTGSILQNKVGSLSEGQKGLLSFARFVMQKPQLLILDEPSNHINFRHLPVIAKALADFKGAIIMVSHDNEFTSHINFSQTLDLGRYGKSS